MTVEQKEKKVPKSKTKMQTCPTCGTVFETVKGKYCSKECKKTIEANCIECGKCEKHCPQGISIREELKNVKGLFE